MAGVGGGLWLPACVQSVAQASFCVLQDRSPPTLITLFKVVRVPRCPLASDRVLVLLLSTCCCPGARKVTELDEAQAITASAPQVRAPGREVYKEHRVQTS